jgi:hypothetical protein
MVVPVYVRFWTEEWAPVVEIESALRCDDALRVSLQGCAIGPPSRMYDWLIEVLLVLPASTLPVEVRSALPPDECPATCIEAFEPLGLTCVGPREAPAISGCEPSDCPGT